MPHELRIGLRIRASREQVFEHILLPQHLARWWSNFAQVEPRPGGKFVFGGDYVITQPDGPAWKCAFTGGSVKKSVTFAWPLFGADTTVMWEVDDAPDGARLRATHANLPTLEGTAGSLLDAWRVCLGNLKAIAEGRGDSLRPDSYPVKNPRIKLDLLLDVPAANVFAALTEPDQLRHWTNPKEAPVVEARVGGRYHLGRHGMGGTVAAWEPGKRLAVELPVAGRATRATFALEGKSGNRCGLYFVHEGFSPEDSRMIVNQRGRWSDLLVGMKNYLEAGETGFTEPYDAEVLLVEGPRPNA